MQSAAWLAATLGHFEEALVLSRQAVELDPLDVSEYTDLAVHAYYAGRLEEAIAACKKTGELIPEHPSVQRWISRVYLAQSRPQEALAEMQRSLDPGFRAQGLALAYHALGRNRESDVALTELIAKFHGTAAFQIAEVYAFRGEADRAFEWLERAYSQRDSGLTETKGDPLLKSLEHDPRYTAFLKKMRLPL
ncbi:MAG TPA: tetratricopeptide repeat protein [Terriglobales bacterium]|nr:tetratricopeptide repeat protein [Terriglobales bacterium]